MSKNFLPILTLGWLTLTCLPGHARDGPLIDAMDELSFRAPARQGRVEAAAGTALKFTFDNDSSGAFAVGRGRWLSAKPGSRLRSSPSATR